MNINSQVDAIANQSLASNGYQNYTNIQGLDGLKQQAREDQRSALKPVAEQFEALFIQQVFKEARKVSFDDGWLDGNQGDFYKDWHDKQLSQDLAAKGSLGFADKIVEQLLPNIPGMAPEQAERKTVSENTAEPTQQQTATTDAALALRFSASKPDEK